MKILYVDNFRGFQDTYINFEQVNFLIGENSTGKSSILQLLQILSDYRFPFELRFNTDEFQFGGFLDILSKQSTNNKIRIGFIQVDEKTDDQNDEETTNKSRCVLLSIKNEDNNPILDAISYIKHDIEIRLKFAKKSFKYKYFIRSFSENIKQEFLNIFESWIEIPVYEDKNYKRETFKRIPDGGPRPFFFFAYAEYLINKNIKKTSKKSAQENIEENAPLSLEVFFDLGFTSSNYWFSPVRSKPQRIYDSLSMDYSPDGTHVPILIKKILNSNRKDEFITFIHDFGKESGLFEGINIHKFSKSGMSPFELNIILGNENLRISDVGYGISQFLPILVELFWKSKNSWFSLQQPEIHLHPKAQAAVGELIYQLAKNDNKGFFIETHSDFIIDRFRTEIKEDKSTDKITSQVLFFERDGLVNKVHEIKINNDGTYKGQPEHFRDFFIHEELKNLGL